jgi:hypothetical protein
METQGEICQKMYLTEGYKVTKAQESLDQRHGKKRVTCRNLALKLELFFKEDHRKTQLERTRSQRPSSSQCETGLK